MTLTKSDLSAIDNLISKRIDSSVNSIKKDLEKLDSKITENSVGFSETVLSGVQDMFDKSDKKQEHEFDKLENKIKLVNQDLKSEIDGLKSEFSTSVSKKEFNQLKSKVNRFHPAN